MFKMSKMAGIRCQVEVYEDLNAVFWKEKDKKWKTNKNFPIFNVLCNFCRIFVN